MAGERTKETRTPSSSSRSTKPKPRPTRKPTPKPTPTKLRSVPKATSAPRTKKYKDVNDDPARRVSTPIVLDRTPEQEKRTQEALEELADDEIAYESDQIEVVPLTQKESQKETQIERTELPPPRVKSRKALSHRERRKSILRPGIPDVEPDKTIDVDYDLQLWFQEPVENLCRKLEKEQMRLLQSAEKTELAIDYCDGEEKLPKSMTIHPVLTVPKEYQVEMKKREEELIKELNYKRAELLQEFRMKEVEDGSKRVRLILQEIHMIYRNEYEKYIETDDAALCGILPQNWLKFIESNISRAFSNAKYKVEKISREKDAKRNSKEARDKLKEKSLVGKRTHNEAFDQDPPSSKDFQKGHPNREPERYNRGGRGRGRGRGRGQTYRRH